MSDLIYSKFTKFDNRFRAYFYCGSHFKVRVKGQGYLELYHSFKDKCIIHNSYEFDMKI